MLLIHTAGSLKQSHVEFSLSNVCARMPLLLSAWNLFTDQFSYILFFSLDYQLLISHNTQKLWKIKFYSDLYNFPTFAILILLYLNSGEHILLELLVLLVTK